MENPSSSLRSHVDIGQTKDMSHRIQLETQDLILDPPHGITVTVDDTNAHHFHVVMAGPSESPYEGGAFKLDIFLPSTYPFEPPKFQFMTKIYHPNIDSLGRICLEIFKNDTWGTAYTVGMALVSVQYLLGNPNPDDPLVNHVGELWRKDEDAAKAMAKQWTKQYAVKEDM